MRQVDVQFGIEALPDLISRTDYDKLFVLCDQNTKKYCWHLLPHQIQAQSYPITIPSGDVNKTLSTCENIWKDLISQKASRRSLLINLGGGMVTDIGGFAASAFKRGIPFINVPTSLLGVVDAAIGGKTGVNFQEAKNQIGIFSEPLGVVVEKQFFETLPTAEFDSGMAEVIKYGLVRDASLFARIVDGSAEVDLDWLLKRCIQLKEEIITEDPYEKGVRQLLNFGHTIGHAIEGHSYAITSPLRHGHAIAIGMAIESHISQKRLGFSGLDQVMEVVLNRFEIPTWLHDSTHIAPMIELMKHDKKNVGEEIKCSLLQEIGLGVVGFSLSHHEITKAFEWFKKAHTASLPS